jgi:hypothetical protein
LGILPAMADGDGDLQGGGTRPHQLILVEELPKARRNKPHHTAGVAWDMLTEEERHRVGLLLSAVENRGVSTQRLPGKIGEGWGTTTTRWFFLSNGDWRDDVWWLGGRCHPTSGPGRGVGQ